MAQTIACDFCQQEPAAILIGNLDNGDQVAVGAGCAVNALHSLADQFTTPPALPMPSEPEMPAQPAEDAGAAYDAAPRPSPPEDEAATPDGPDDQSPSVEVEPAAEHTG